MSEIIPAGEYCGNNRLIPVLHIELYSRFNCDHFFDFEKWDYVRQLRF